MENSVRKAISLPQDSIAEITLILHSKYGAQKVFCVVEGAADKSLYGKFVDNNTTIVFNPGDVGRSGGKKYVESIVDAFNKHNPTHYIFGIVDCDYSRYANRHDSTPDVFQTDARDLEMMLIDTPSVEKDLNTWNAAFPAKIKESCGVCRYLGYLRIFSEITRKKCNLNECFKIPLIWDDASHCLKANVPEILLDEYNKYCKRKIEGLFCKCKVIRHFKCKVRKREIKGFIAARRLEAEPDTHICRGHDVLGLLTKMMVHVDIYNERAIRNHMINAYSYDDFKTTSLFQDIKQWADDNQVKVLLDN